MRKWILFCSKQDRVIALNLEISVPARCKNACAIVKSALSWYLALLEMSVDRPILLPRWPNLLELCHSHQLHLLRGKLQLAAWILSGESSQIEAFPWGLLKSSWSSGTSKQCNTARKASCRWCSERSSDPFQATIDTFIDFLFSTFDQAKPHPVTVIQSFFISFKFHICVSCRFLAFSVD